MLNYHSFHIVDQRPWPLICSFNTINLLSSLVLYIKYNNFNNYLNLIICFLLLITTSFIWWRDISRERSFQGHHTSNVLKGLKLRIILFITREIIFFFSFFWRFFHSSLAPELEIGNSWPPTSIIIFNPYQIPLLNTIILLRSGVTVTWTHHAILNKSYKTSTLSLITTILLGITFSYFQYLEYNWSEFSINDSIFGSTFFIATGFHGFHVLIGTIFLLVNLLRIFKCLFNNKHHFSFEAAAWYWHFVDIVWLYLYTFVYWWFFFLISIKSTFNFQLKSLK